MYAGLNSSSPMTMDVVHDGRRDTLPKTVELARSYGLLPPPSPRHIDLGDDEDSCHGRDVTPARSRNPDDGRCSGCQSPDQPQVAMLHHLENL